MEITDPRDDKTYGIVTIGDQVWMAENLDYEVSDGAGSWCLDDDPANCDTYGRLYDWPTAMAGAPSSGETFLTDPADVEPSGVQGVCPAGWHLPSDGEWKLLEIYLGVSQSGTNQVNMWNEEGLKLIATSGWKGLVDDEQIGTDDFGFTALPGSYRTENGVYGTEGFEARFWTTTENGTDETMSRHMKTDMYAKGISRVSSAKADAHSVRCVMD